ncbi:hypothetical protein J2X31_003705 [Flavobacterium arsenatis]|uniref:Uncharacterized protein n=1 Tax=Flavobacterium arsenatis TaxID=1484332 RepID=A0ABU1TUY3_9FLAO|nr:hypothetical protein [Flavobacterium arsenatis]MDR6969671.1 hypothetical protein [Flavobacterium arsenatis]
MNGIKISNETYYDKDHNKTFSYQEKYKSFSIGSVFSTLVPFYANLLKPIVGDKIEETFKDFALSKEQTEQIQAVFEEQIDLHIPKMETKLPYDNFIEWKGKKYEMNLRLHSPMNRRIMDFYKIITICKECLAEDKPMSIE